MEELSYQEGQKQPYAVKWPKGLADTSVLMQQAVIENITKPNEEEKDIEQSEEENSFTQSLANSANLICMVNLASHLVLADGGFGSKETAGMIKAKSEILQSQDTSALSDISDELSDLLRGQRAAAVDELQKAVAKFQAELQVAHFKPGAGVNGI